jgi:uncharacterized protein YbjQ (UPF0145 family)
MAFDYIVLALFVISLITGKLIERKHFRSLDLREEAVEDQILKTTKSISSEIAAVGEIRLVCGEAVIAAEFFRWIMGAFKSLFGGPIRSYESIIDRARREALLRMRKAAGDAVEIVNVRLEYAPISYGLSSKSSCVEAIAYGTAIYLKGDHESEENQA